MARRRRSSRRALKGRGRPRSRGRSRSLRGGARRRRPRRLGSVIRVRKTSGLGQLNKPSSMMGSMGPALIGAATTAGVTIGLRMMQPRTEMQMRLMENAPWVGSLAGGVVALLVGSMSGRPAGWGVAAGSSGVGLAMVASEAVAKQRLMANNGNGGGPVGRLRGGTGAIVMEPHASRGYGAGPLGAIVPEYANTRGLSGRGGRLGAYGDTVNLGNVNQSAFGTPGFNVRGRAAR